MLAPAAQPELYNKLCQRYITAITSLMREGRLYEVDTRLRPSGMDGALAVSVGAFDKYFNDSAWTFEFMALTRARAITGSPALRTELSALILRHMTQKRGRAKLVADIAALRAKVAQEFKNDNPWNLKYAEGGLMDLDFLAQYFVLLYAHDHPGVIAGSGIDVFQAMIKEGLLGADTGRKLTDAHRFYHALFTLLRLCGGGVIDEAKAPQGLKFLIAGGLELSDFPAVKARLLATLAEVREIYTQFLNPSQKIEDTL
jgi:glutamate-ammonia-ligase adenylyltransferase